MKRILNWCCETVKHLSQLDRELYLKSVSPICCNSETWRTVASSVVERDRKCFIVSLACNNTYQIGRQIRLITVFHSCSRGDD